METNSQATGLLPQGAGAFGAGSRGAGLRAGAPAGGSGAALTARRCSISLRAVPFRARFDAPSNSEQRVIRHVKQVGKS